MLGRDLNGLRVLVTAAGVVTAVLAFAPPADAAEPPPAYQGDMEFPAIQGPEGPEEFSWLVELGPRQEFVQVDDRDAEVRNQNGSSAVAIAAERAHDENGTEVPTTLSVSEGDIVTLIVHHRNGNPETGGSPFHYPILPGPGFTPTYTPAIVIPAPLPPDKGGYLTQAPVRRPCAFGKHRVFRDGHSWCKRNPRHLHHAKPLLAH